MPNFLKDNEDLLYYLDRGLDWDPLVRATERDSTEYPTTADAVDVYREVASLVGGFVGDEMAPRAAAIDREGLSLVDGEVVFPEILERLFVQIRGLDLHGLCVPRELGGMNGPLLLYFVTAELMARADVSVMSHHSFHGGVAMALLVFSMREGTTKLRDGKVVETRFREAIEEIVRGDAWGAMDITEPHAGSDMAELRTRAVQDDEGRWFVTGQKIFITSGHGKYHLVIARTEDRAAGGDDAFVGLAGLSMFLVKAYEDRPDGTRHRFATVDRLEEKLGHHGSATCSVTFDRTPAELIGKRGEGFSYMLTLMNNARLGVGFECIGLCEAAYRAALDYARERPTMGKTIDRHEMIADYLDEMRTDIQGLRALAMHGAYHEELAQKLGLSGDANAETEKRVRRHKRKARRVTPLLKYLAAEKAVEMARRSLQIHGGNGYTKDYPAERLLRDALVMPIYEGTSQIQALMAMKDRLSGILKDPRAFVGRMAQARWRAISARDPLERRVARLGLVSLGVQQHLMMRTAGDKFRSLQGKSIAEWPDRFLKNWDPKRDFAFAMLHAERLTRILADELTTEILLEQSTRHPERREVLERYLERAEPRCRHLADVITTTGDRLLEQLSVVDEAAHAAE
jgi:hypothetical protein